MRIFDDFRDAGRSLRTQPRFLLITSLTLALGIAAATAIFSVVNGVLLRPLPYAARRSAGQRVEHGPGAGLRPVPAVAGSVPLLPPARDLVFEDMTLFHHGSG